jgi:hypothetical protein
MNSFRQDRTRRHVSNIIHARSRAAKAESFGFMFFSMENGAGRDLKQESIISGNRFEAFHSRLKPVLRIDHISFIDLSGFGVPWPGAESHGMEGKSRSASYGTYMRL